MSATGFLLVLLTAALTMAANLLLRAGIDAAGGFQIGGLRRVGSAFFRLLIQPLFSVGCLIYFTASVVWFRVVATEPLSLAYPVLVSATFALVTGGAVFFFSERLSARKVIGLAIILAGIAIISSGRALT